MGMCTAGDQNVLGLVILRARDYSAWTRLGIGNDQGEFSFNRDEALTSGKAQLLSSSGKNWYKYLVRSTSLSLHAVKPNRIVRRYYR